MAILITLSTYESDHYCDSATLDTKESQSLQLLSWYCDLFKIVYTSGEATCHFKSTELAITLYSEVVSREPE